MIKIALNLTPDVAGSLTLGPRPGTPEFADEQRCRAAGIPYDYSKGRKLLLVPDPPAVELEPPTLRGAELLPPPEEGAQG